MSKSKFTHEVMQPLRVESGLTQLDLEIYLLKAEVDRLTSGSGGIMEMKQTIADKEAEIERLKQKCDKQAMFIRRIFPETFPETPFISGVMGEKDQNNMPKMITVCPAFGVDFSYVYEYNGRTIGGMGS